MKMTKVIREYITESVVTKYQPTIDAIKAKKDAALEKINDVKKQTVEELNKIVVRMYRERLAPFYTEDDLGTLLRDRNWVYDPSYYGVYTIEVNKYNAEINRLQSQRDAAIKNILITLELGGTKADLDRMLSEVNVEG